MARAWTVCRFCTWVEDNGYAISVPLERQTAGGSISGLVSGFPDLLVIDVDGTDFLASYDALAAAAEHCRSGRGPALVHAKVTRPYSHALSDDERLYKTAGEREAEALRDPLTTFPQYLISEGLLDRNTLQRILQEVEVELQQATDRVFESGAPASRLRLRSSLFGSCRFPLQTISSLSRASPGSRERWWTPLTSRCTKR